MEIEIDAGAASPIRAKWDADRRCRQLLEDGWVQVEGTREATASQPELLAALAANPDDLDTIQIYGDWLAERDDPWGQIILIQHALATLPRFGQTERRDSLQREDIRLRFVHAARLWGALGEQVIDEPAQKYAADLVEATWRCGFVRDALLRGLPEEIELVLAPLASLEITRFLRTLALQSTHWERRTCDAIAAQRWPHLEKLEIRATHRDLDARWIVPILAPEVTPRLTELCVESSSSTDGLCFALATNPIGARLQKLHLLDAALTKEGLAFLNGGSFDSLRSLKLTGSGPPNAKRLLSRIAPDLHIELGA